jgi:hypothetical protein
MNLVFEYGERITYVVCTHHVVDWTHKPILTPNKMYVIAERQYINGELYNIGIIDDRGEISYWHWARFKFINSIKEKEVVAGATI